MTSAKKFFYHLLAQQNPVEDEPQISDERIRDLLAQTAQITPAEQKILLNSPLTRERFRLLTAARQMTQIQAMQQWDSIDALAARDNNITPLFYKKTEYDLDFLPLDPEGQDWKIVLTIKEPQRRSLLAQELALIDDQGTVWLRGQADNTGVLQGFWTQAEPLWDLLHQRRLHLEIMPN